MGEKNQCAQLVDGLAELFSADTHFITFKNKTYCLSDPELPVSAGLGIIRSQCRALEEAVKEAKDAGQ